MAISCRSSAGVRGSLRMPKSSMISRGTVAKDCRYSFRVPSTMASASTPLGVILNTVPQLLPAPQASTRAAVGCAVEVPVGSLDQPPRGSAAVGATALRAEGVKRRQYTTGSNLEDRPAGSSSINPTGCRRSSRRSSHRRPGPAPCRVLGHLRKRPAKLGSKSWKASSTCPEE